MRKTFRKHYALPGVAALALGLMSAPASAWCDFITGGGFGTTTADGRHPPAQANFGAHGGCKKAGPDAPFWGHVNYIDHFYSPTGHFRSLTITGYQCVSGCGDEKNPKRTGTRRICGTGEIINPAPLPVTFSVEMTDNGERGTSDRFEIGLRNGAFYYHAEFTLEGGNIQLHKPNPSTTGTFGSCPAP